jgi:hypothetical protein
MKLHRVIAILFYVVIFTVVIFGQGKSDRVRDGLKGSVKSVTVEEARISNRFGKSVEEERKLIEVVQYDTTGNRVVAEAGDAITGLSKNGAIRFEYTRDTDASLNETGYDSNKVIKWRTIFAFNTRGDVTEETVYKLRGNSFVIDGKKVYSYYPNGRLREMIEYNSNGDIYVRSTYSYSGNTVSESESSKRLLDKSFDITGYKNTYIYDARGNLILESSLAIEKKPKKNNTLGKHKYNYELDAKGNWTKKIAYRWITDEGPPYFKQYHVTYRNITYY